MFILILYYNINTFEFIILNVNICVEYPLTLLVNTDIQINNVEPVMDERKEHLLRKLILEQILRHYR